MSKLKRVLSVILVVALVAAASVAGTVTYLTDRDSQANVFSIGDVSIRLNGALEKGISLIPGVTLATDINIENTGRNAAWVWMTYAIPAALDAEGNKAVQVNTHGAYRYGGYMQEVYYTEVGLNEPVDEGDTWLVDEEIGEVEINGKLYNLHTLMYKGTLDVGETTNPGISQIWMDGRIDVDPDGNLHMVANGVVTDLDWNINTDSNPVIYVSAYAIQEEGFADVKAAYEAYGQQWGENGEEYDVSSLYELMTSNTATVFNARGENTGKKAASSTVGVTGKPINFGTVLTQESLDAIGIADSSMSSDDLRKIVLDYFKLQQSFTYTPTEEVPIWPAAAGSTALNQKYFETYVDPDYVFDQYTGKAFHTDTIYAGMPYVNDGYGTLYRWIKFYNEETGEMDLAGALDEYGGGGNLEWTKPNNETLYDCNWYTEGNYTKWDTAYDATKEGWLYTSSGGPKEPKKYDEDTYYITASDVISLISDADFKAGIKAFAAETVSVDGKNYIVVEKCSDGKWRPIITAAQYSSQLAMGNACSQGSAAAWERVINSAMLWKASNFNSYNGMIPVGRFDFKYEIDGVEYGLENIIEFGDNLKDDLTDEQLNPDLYSTDDVAKYWIEKNPGSVLGQAIYECYALVKPADALANDGHVLMVTGVHVERNADGSIDPEKSYITVYEQNAVLGFYGSIVDENGTSANYMVHGAYVSDFDDEEYDSVEKRNGNYGERYYSFKSLLFGTKAADSIDNITAPYLPWTFAEFHYGEENEESKAYIEYYMNVVPETRPIHRYQAANAQRIVNEAGYTLTKDGEKAFAGIGVEKAQAYAFIGKFAAFDPDVTTPIKANQFMALEFVANYCLSDLTVEVIRDDTVIANLTGLATAHYAMHVKISRYELIGTALQQTAKTGDILKVSIQLYNGEVIPVFTGKLIP